MAVLSTSNSSSTHIPPLICGNCGKKEQTDIKLQQCGKCFFQKYCGRECQIAHWQEHKKICHQLGKQKRIENVWNSIGQQYQVWSKSEPAKPIYEGLPAPLLVENEELLKKHGNEERTAIDLGCGLGYSTFLLLRAGYKVIAVDRDKHALRLACQNIDKYNPRFRLDGTLTVVSSDIESYVFPSKVSLVVINDVLPYCNPRSIRAIWDNIFNNLEENGLLCGSLFEERALISSNWTKCWFIKNESMFQEFMKDSSYEIIESRRRPKPGRPTPSAVLEFFLRKKEIAESR